MIIAVTAKDNHLDSQVDERFGRATQFLVYDTESKKFQPYDNSQSLESAQGAGIQSAESIVKFKADVVLTGHCGPKAFRVLNAAGIKVVIGVSGSVQSAINDFLAGKLKSATGPDVEGHW
jgi:predicted Fe-Mo cluster-binding NifX family protein